MKVDRSARRTTVSPIQFRNFMPPSTRTPAQRLARILQRESLIIEGNHYYKERLDFDYYDNPDNPTGYGGYHYDGRFSQAARDIMSHFELQPGARVFELGTAKGFLLAEFAKLGCAIFGQDASSYAIHHAHPLALGRILLEQAPVLPWQSHWFDLIIAKDVLPHLPEASIDDTLAGLVRMAKGPILAEIECGRTAFEKNALHRWDETHLICQDPVWWLDRLLTHGFQGSVCFKVLVVEEGLPEEVDLENDAAIQNLLRRHAAG